jgi:hypothetical protein
MIFMTPSLAGACSIEAPAAEDESRNDAGADHDARDATQMCVRASVTVARTSLRAWNQRRGRLPGRDSAAIRWRFGARTRSDASRNRRASARSDCAARPNA